MLISRETKREFAEAITELEEKAELLWSRAERAGFAIAYDTVLDKIKLLAYNARDNVR